MSAPDELAEMKRRTVTHTFWDPMHKSQEYDIYLASDADRVIAARDARIAELERDVASLQEALVLALTPPSADEIDAAVRTAIRERREQP